MTCSVTLKMFCYPFMFKELVRETIKLPRVTLNTMLPPPCFTV